MQHQQPPVGSSPAQGPNRTGGTNLEPTQQPGSSLTPKLVAPDSDSPYAAPTKQLPPSHQRLSLLVPPPSTVVVPPTPVDVSPRSATLLNSLALQQPLVEEEAVEYDSPDEDDDVLPTPPASSSRGNSTNSMSKPSLLKRLSSSDSSTRSPPALHPSTLPSSSPHLFAELGRVPSPSSSGSEYRRPGHGHNRRESSTHRVRETIYGEQRMALDGERLVNQYRLGHKLGKGAYATVTLAIDVGTGIEYAMKEFSKSRLQHQAIQERQQKAARERRLRGPLRPGAAKLAAPRPDISRGNSVDEDMLAKDPLALIRREIAVMKKLDHPNLTHLYEAISVPNADGLFLVLEYLPGGVLMHVEAGADETNARSPFTGIQVREYFRQICLALEYLHANGVAHRDIKPDNILFTADRTMVKLADFGVSEIFQTGDDSVKTQGGSPAFLAPECFAGSSSEVHGKQVDIWAFGATFYCMLTGKLPFNVADPMALFARVKEQEPFIPDDWHPDLRRLVTGMLCKDPNQRLTIAGIRENVWVTDWGCSPMMPIEENLFYFGKVFEEPTTEEVSSAITSLRSVFTVVRAVQKMRKLNLSRRSLSGYGLPTPTESVASGSVDSYHLPEAVSPGTLGVLSGGSSPNLVESPGSADLSAELSTTPERSDPFETLPAISTDSSTSAGGVLLATEPGMVASFAESLYQPEPIYEVDSPDEAASPAQFDSPSQVDSPVQVHSPVEVDSPSQVNSPVQIDSPEQCESPPQFESPTDVDGPDFGMSNPQIVEVSYFSSRNRTPSIRMASAHEGFAEPIRDDSVNMDAPTLASIDTMNPSRNQSIRMESPDAQHPTNSPSQITPLAIRIKGATLDSPQRADSPVEVDSPVDIVESPTGW